MRAISHDGNEVEVLQCSRNSDAAAKITSRLQSGPVLVHSTGSVASKVSRTRVHPLDNPDNTNAPDRRRSTSKMKSQYLWLRCGLAGLASICLLWTIWLILLTVAPNETVNRIMHTKMFDDGTFWLQVDTPPSLLWPSILGFSLVALGYAATIVEVLRHSNRNHRAPSFIRSLGSFDAMKANFEKIVVGAAVDRTRCKITSSAAQLMVSLTQSESPRRKLVNVCLKICDLIVEAVLLFGILEAGSPIVLATIFTVIVESNAFCCIIMMFLPFEKAGLAEILIDVFFDFLIAVGYPIIVLTHCFSTFQFDHDRLAINLKVFPAGWFEQSASAIANPVQTDIIHKSLMLLRAATVTDMLTRITLNLIFSIRLYRVATRIQHSERLSSANIYPKRHRAATTILVIFVVILTVFVEESIRTSATACSPHPECVVKAHRWIMLENGSMTQCPCLTLIDGNIAPKTYYEWVHPRDMTEKVTQLAATGDLQTIQLINRYLPSLPDELRRCNKMTHLSLVYTQTVTVPVWIHEFTKLQYLHIEGTGFFSLISLPEGMFDSMSSLTFIHLGVHPVIEKLPSFTGLTSLKSLALALLLSLIELPSFDNLHNLQRVVITSLVRIDSLPDLAPLTKLTSFAVADRASWCCNGFLDECDLHSPHCKVHPLWGTPAATCLAVNRTDDRPTQATLDVLRKFSHSICGELILPGTAEGSPTEAGMNQCNGTLYRQCEVPGHREAMCYNARFMGISCSSNPYPIEMRRRQIEDGVGERCDPVFEAWLGCNKKA